MRRKLREAPINLACLSSHMPGFALRMLPQGKDNGGKAQAAHGSFEARTGLRDSHRGKSRTGHYPMMVGDPKIVYGTPVD